MNDLVFFRTILLVIGVFKLLTATVFDGIMVRYVMRSLVQRLDSLSHGRAKYPPGALFMLEHGWARRLYNLAIAASVLGAWWFLGTPAGLAMVHRSR